MNRTLTLRLAKLERATASQDTYWAIGGAESEEEIQAFRDRTGFAGVVILTGITGRDGLQIRPMQAGGKPWPLRSGPESAA